MAMNLDTRHLRQLFSYYYHREGIVLCLFHFQIHRVQWDKRPRIARIFVRVSDVGKRNLIAVQTACL